MEKRLPKSVRKFLRREKARIRGQFLDAKMRGEKMKELLQKIKYPLTAKDGGVKLFKRPLEKGEKNAGKSSVEE